MKLKIKDQLPDTEIFQLVDGEPQKSKLREIIGNGKTVLFGLPGAFTSTCSKLHLPGFVANADKIKAKGIENIFCLSVNDPYVMNGWGEINNTGDKIKMLSDPYLVFTKAIGAEVDRNAKGMGIRSNRYLMVIENFTVIKIHKEEETKECGLTSFQSPCAEYFRFALRVHTTNYEKAWRVQLKFLENLSWNASGRSKTRQDKTITKNVTKTRQGIKN